MSAARTPRDVLWDACRSKTCCRTTRVVLTGADLARLVQAFELEPGQFAQPIPVPDGDDGPPGFLLEPVRPAARARAAQARRARPARRAVRVPRRDERRARRVRRGRRAPGSLPRLPGRLEGSVLRVAAGGCDCRRWSLLDLGPQERAQAEAAAAEEERHAGAVRAWNETVRAGAAHAVARGRVPLPDRRRAHDRAGDLALRALHRGLLPRVPRHRDRARRLPHRARARARAARSSPSSSRAWARRRGLPARPRPTSASSSRSTSERRHAGWCVFWMPFGETSGRCGIYAHRPQVCRTYPATLVDGEVARRDDVLCPAGAGARAARSPAPPGAGAPSASSPSSSSTRSSTGAGTTPTRRPSRRTPFDAYLSWMLGVYAALDADPAAPLAFEAPDRGVLAALARVLEARPPA